MTTNAVHLIGAGGHGRVVVGALVAGGLDPALIVMRDARAGLTMFGRTVVTPEVEPGMAGQRFHVAVGAASIRARLHAAALAVGAMPLSAVHPAAMIAADARLGAGLLVAAGAIVAPGASVGDGTLVNHGAVVDHDVQIGTFCHIAPHATLGGEVSLSDRVMIGAGAVVLPGVHIADDVTVGAGSVVLRSIEEPGVWVGSPARKLMK